MACNGEYNIHKQILISRKLLYIISFKLQLLRYS